MHEIFKEGLFQSKKIIVTGGGSGLGKEMVRQFLQLGGKVATCGRTMEKLEKVREQFSKDGLELFIHRCDIRDIDSVEEFIDWVIETLGGIDVLVNNAGGQFPSPAENMTPKGWQAVINNNLNGTFNMIWAVGKKWMIPEKRGKIISIVANIWNGFPGLAHTGAARAGVVNLTMSLAVEWAQYNIRINAVAPGTIATEGMRVYPREVVEMAREWIPLKRYGKSEEVAYAVLFLASPAGDFITGETIKVDGGESIYGNRWIIPDNPEAKEESEILLRKILDEKK